jgi:RNA polymerase sigma-70 factor (ECF subfamily)
MNFNDVYTQIKIKGGDIREFERLFEKYYQPLCLHAYKILKDMDTAEDMVQELFYNVWKNRETMSIRFSLNAYLYEAIRLNSLHYIKHLHVEKSYSEQVLSKANNAVPEIQDSGMDTKELNNIIAQTLKQMPVRCCRIFCLNRFEGKKYREIAEMLSISVKTVEADMGKALQLFRKSLKDYTHYVS